MPSIKEKAVELFFIFDEYPKVFRRFIFYVLLAPILSFIYIILLNWLNNLNFIGIYPFAQWIVENYNLLRWGILLVPFFVLLWAWADISDLYFELKNKRYH